MYKEIDFFDFQRMFPNEKKCQQFLFNCRWPKGFECPKCHCQDYSYIVSRGLYQCSDCRYQCSLKVGTIFEKSKTPLHKWFWMIFLLSQSKNSYSALALSRLLSIAYLTALSMTHKIRTAMASRDSNYQLSGLIEMDDTYFGGKNASGKRGRGADNKTTVIVGVQLTEDDTPQYASMITVEDLSEEQVTEAIKERVKSGSTIKSDAYSSYKVLERYEYKHQPLKIGDPKNASKLLHWVHIMIANAKGIYRGTHHGVSKKHLQKYLSEFCYRFNRRYNLNQLFDRLLLACIRTEPIKIAELFA
jgi:transposase-like protein